MKIKFFAQLKSVTGTGECDLPVRGTLHAAQLWELLVSQYPGLSQWRDVTRVAKNFSYTDEKAEFADTDEVALIPPVSGG